VIFLLEPTLQYTVNVFIFGIGNILLLKNLAVITTADSMQFGNVIFSLYIFISSLKKLNVLQLQLLFIRIYSI